jgi:polyhydroxybutyrate depolymerase
MLRLIVGDGLSRRWVAFAVLFSTILVGLGAAHAESSLDDWRGTLLWEGRERSYLMHVSAAAGNRTLPLVIALHGAGQDAAAFAVETQFALEADSHDMIVVFPDGTGTTPGSRSWNAQFCCGLATKQHVDDIGFISALIDRIAADLPVDRRRVYATGMSNGGMLAYQLAAAHPERLAAIAAVSSTIGGTSRDGDRFVIAAPDRPVPVMIVHGREDSYVLFDGGSSSMLSFPKRSNMAVSDAVSFWTTVDGCAVAPEQTEPMPGKLRRVAYPNCKAGSEVILWEIEDGEHNWPADAQFPSADGRVRSAAAEIVEFFAAHARE